MSAGVLAAADEMRDFMFERVYLWEAAQRESQGAKRIVSFLFDYYTQHSDDIASDFTLPGDTPYRRAADYVAGMTDGFARELAAGLGFAQQ
jgi:dGTPase